MPPDDPRNWRLDVEQDRIDLYLELLERSRPLAEDEARMMDAHEPGDRRVAHPGYRRREASPSA
jgi:hypothetical protein